MATAGETSETNTKKVITAFVRARVALLLPIFRDLNQLMFSPISLTYIQAMARAAVQDQQLKTQIMDIKMLDQLESEDAENFLHRGMSDLLSSLNTDGLVSNASIQNNIFNKNVNSVPEKYLTFLDSFYGPRVGPLKRYREMVNITREDVNQWISEQSRGTINDFVSESNFDKCRDFLLVNCVYFTGKWQFDSSKSLACKKQHYLRNTAIKCVIASSSLSGDRYGTAFAFPESSNAIRQLFEMSRSEPNFFFVQDGLEPSSIECSFPIGVFQFNTHYQNLIFDKYVDDVRTVTQKVYLEITDKFMTAAAVTLLSNSVPEATKEEAPADIVPTFFMIYDNFERAILFMASNLHV